MTYRPQTLDELLALCSPSARRLIQAARKTIRVAVPDAVERYRPGWGLVGYNAPHYFCFVVADERGVRIGLEWGVALSDPLGLLEGEARQIRYLPLRSLEDLARPELTELLQEAAAFKPARTARKR